MTNNFYIHQTGNPDQILRAIEGTFQIIRERSFSGIRRQYDTFDWRLYKKNLELISEQGRFWLVTRNGSDNTWRIRGSHRPVFAEDFQDPVIREKLLPILEMRALNLVFSIKIERIRGGIIDANHKTTLRFEIEKIVSGTVELPAHIKLIPLRGFSSAAVKMRTWVSANGFEPTGKSAFDRICELSGVRPGSYSSKLNISLDGRISVRKAVNQIHRELLNTIKLNEAGIIKDIDTEFLHDFRVAVRRTRSLYDLARTEIDPGLLARAKTDFGYLGKLTNRMRDVDVYLLNRKKYLDMLPWDLLPVMARFFKDLEKERRRELLKVRTALKSQRYRQIIAFWKSVPDRNVAEDGESIPVKEFARIMISDMLRKVLKIGAKIDASSPDALLHKLRIACKKLRYALEFYTSLFPPEITSVLIRQVKMLQDNLGEYNDLAVQQRELHDYVRQLKEPVQRELVLAVGFLISALNRRQKSKRFRFAETYARFAGDETQKIFYDIKQGLI